MTDLERFLTEWERRFRERTPPKRVDEMLASYRVGRGEMRRWASEQGIKIDELAEETQLALLKVGIKLRREFPDERWDDYNAADREFARQHKIKLPRGKRKNGH